MHVHVDTANHTPQSLKNALTIMYAKEDILFKVLKVNENRVQRWCQKVREPSRSVFRVCGKPGGIRQRNFSLGAGMERQRRIYDLAFRDAGTLCD